MRSTFLAALAAVSLVATPCSAAQPAEPPDVPPEQSPRPGNGEAKGYLLIGGLLALFILLSAVIAAFGDGEPDSP